jgi:small GTP-binding protein
MGNEISEITQKMCMKSSNYKILILGLEGSGKTTLFDRLKYNEVYIRYPTIGFLADNIKISKLNVTLWDFGGNSKMIKLWSKYFNNTDLVILVVDSTDYSCNEELENIFLLLEKELKNVYILVILNKSDLKNSMKEGEFLDYFHIEKYNLKICKIIRASLVKGNEMKEIKKNIKSVLKSIKNYES